jgi:hypothetical protein
MAPVMTFIQQHAPERAGFPRKGEESARSGRAGDRRFASGANEPRITRRGAWRVGGLAGAVVYSAVCWMAVYHGGKAAIAWMRPPAQVEAAATGAPPPFAP